MKYILYAVALIIAGVAFKASRQILSVCRRQSAVGKKVALVMPTVDPSGSVEMRFMPGVFEEVENHFFLKTTDRDAEP